MLEYKQSIAAKVPVYLLNQDTNLPMDGINSGQVTAAYMKADGTVSSFTVDNSTWTEVTSSAFASEGVYYMTLPSAATSQQGILIYIVKVTDARTYRGVVKVVTNEEVDTITIVNAIRTDYTTTRAGYLDLVNAMRTDYTTARAVKIDNLDATITSRLATASAGTTIWGTAVSGNTTSGTFGAAVNTVNTTTASTATAVAALPSASTNAAAVWNAVAASFNSAGSFGEFLQNNLDVTVSSRGSASTLSTIAGQVATIPTNPLLTNDVRLNYLDSSISTMSAKVDVLHHVAVGKWEIKTVGADANRLILYDTSGVVLKKFDLRDASGLPNSSAFYSRNPL